MIESLLFQDSKCMEKHLDSLKLTVVDVAKDGNCLSRALLASARLDPNLHYQLRSLLVWENYREWCLDPNDKSPNGVPKSVRIGYSVKEVQNKPLSYLQHASRDGSWMCRSEILMFARIFKICIVIHQEFRTIVVCKFGEESWPRLHLLLSKGHYMALISQCGLSPLPSGNC